MRNWIIFNIVLLMTGAASAQVQSVAAQAQSIGFPSSAQLLRAPASQKAVAKITNDDEISDEMDAANASAQATYRKRVEQNQAAREQYQPAPAPAPRRAPRPAARPQATVRQQIDEGDYNPYAAPARSVYKQAARPQPQTRPVYTQANAEQPVAPAAQPTRPRYQAQPIQLTPNPSTTQIQQFPENQPAGVPAEQDWRPPIRRTGLTLLPTVNLGFGITSADYNTNSVVGVSVQHPSKFIYGGGLMAELGRSTFTFETGVIYVNEMISSSYSGTSLNANTASYNATVGYMGIPVLAKVNFSVIPHRSRLNFNAGVIPSVLVYSNSHYVTVQNGLQRDVSDPNDVGMGLGGFRTFNVFGTAALGGDFTVGSQSDIRAEVAYRRALMSLTQNQNTFEDVFLLNLSFGFDVDWFSRPAQIPGQGLGQAPQAR